MISFFRRVQWWLQRRRKEDELREELEFHLAEEVSERQADGLRATEASWAARRDLGNATLLRENVRSLWSWALLEQVAQDATYALRNIRRAPGFASTVILILALGIGATTAIFSVVYTVVIRPLAYPKADALVRIVHSIDGVDQSFFSDAIYTTYENNAQAFEHVGAWTGGAATANVTAPGAPEEVQALVASRGLLETLAVPAEIGRWFSVDEDRRGAEPTVILSHSYWRRKFAGSDQVLQQAITINSLPHQIIGVMPEAFRLREFDIILPLQIDRGRLGAGFRLVGIARLKPGVTVSQANADVVRMLNIVFDTYGMNTDRSQRWAGSLRPLKDDIVGDVGRTLWVLLGTVAAVLLMACANVANLLLVRGEGRSHELAVRAALGASRARLVRSLLVESLTFALIAGVLGLAVAHVALRILVALAPTNLPRLSEINVETVSVGFALAISLAVTAVFGAIPILRQTRPERTDRVTSGNRNLTASRERYRTQQLIVAAQVAMATALLIGAGLMIRSFQMLKNVDVGFVEPDRVQAFGFLIPVTEIADPERLIAVQHELVEAVGKLPGVTSSAFTTRLPMDMTTRNSAAMTAEDKPEHRPTPPNRHVRFVSPGMFRTLGTRFVAGRDFTWTDVYEHREVAIVSENLAAEMWGSPDAALGKRVREFYVANSPWREIVGVVGNVHDDGVLVAAPATVYWPAQVTSQSFGMRGYAPRRVTVAIRSGRAGSEHFVNEVTAAVRSVAPSVPVSQVRTLGTLYDLSMARTSFALVTLTTAGGMALLLAICGIYAVVSYTVVSQRREIGIRMALGAQSTEIQRLFMRRGLRVTVSGLAVGLATAAASAPLMRSLLFGIAAVDTVTFVAAPPLLAAAAALATYLPARRASRVDPVVALRHE